MQQHPGINRPERNRVVRREKTMLQLQGSPSPLTPTNLTATLELKKKGKKVGHLL